MADFGITAFGAYVPRLRLDRKAIASAHAWMAPGLKGQAKGARAFASWDEDAITMAVEAARDALGPRDLDGVEALLLATTTSPYADLQASSIVAGALGAGERLRAFDLAGAQRAGTSALLQVLLAGRPALVVASDAPVAKAASVQEISFGAGAAAFVLGHDGVVARLVASASVTEAFVDHFRSADARQDYGWEERWVRDESFSRLAPRAAQAALAQAGLAIGDIAHFAMPSPLRGVADAVARQLKFTGEVASGLDDGVGYAGAAHAALMLAALLERAQPGERILLLGFGQGVDALILEATEALPAVRRGRGVSGAMADGLLTDS